MSRSLGKGTKSQRGLAAKATDQSAARLAARAGADEIVADVVDDGYPAHSGRRTSPRHPSAKKSNVVGAANSSQLIAESQSLLSPDNAPTVAKRGKKSHNQTRGAASAAMIGRAGAESEIHVGTGGVPIESQLTAGSDFQGLSSGDLDDGHRSGSSSVVSSICSDPNEPAAEHDANAEDLLVFFNNNDNDDADAGAMDDGVDDLNDYSSDQFSINERVSYFMDRAAITTNNRASVEYVYMIEAETLTRGSGTRGLDDVKKLLHSKYVSLIRQIPNGQFAEFGLREKMIDKYYGAKTGGPSGLYTKVLDVKKKVQAVTRLVDGIGSPLSKIPSGRGLNDVRKQFILTDYKSVMGEVSQCFSAYHCYNFNKHSLLLGVH